MGWCSDNTPTCSIVRERSRTLLPHRCCFAGGPRRQITQASLTLPLCYHFSPYLLFASSSFDDFLTGSSSYSPSFDICNECSTAVSALSLLASGGGGAEFRTSSSGYRQLCGRAGAGNSWLLPGTVGMISCLRPRSFVIVKLPLTRVSPTQDGLVFELTESRNSW